MGSKDRNKQLKMKYKQLTVILILSVLSTLCGIAQQPTGAVCISEDGTSPHSSAMLHVSSERKGVLFPRMTFDAALNIQNKHNGLIVFITDKEKLGYWYWNAAESKWMQIRSEGSGAQDVQAPNNGIILYSGEINSELFNSSGCGYQGTKMEGWQICNGKNLSPNLTGRFIMGSSTGSGDTYGSDQLEIKEENLPKHKHPTNPVKGTLTAHKHGITDHPHHHSVNVRYKKLGRKHHRFAVEAKEHYAHVDYLSTSEDVANDKIKMKEATGTILFKEEGLNNSINVENVGKGKKIENRPSYYVLIYIMKTNEVCTKE